jgi:DNA-binding HxlR family transcriptional regulator
MLASPLSVAILGALGEGPQRQTNLRRAAGSPAQTTLRASLKRLEALGVVERRRLDRFPGALEYELTAAGRDLLSVLATLECWLAAAPGGALTLGSPAAKAAIKSLADAWSTSILRALAAKPLSLTELDGVIGSLSYPAIERRLSGMRTIGQIEAASTNGRRTPYTVTGWLRQAVAPIAAAARWERRQLADATASFGRLDIETAFLLAVPMMRVEADEPATCRIAAEIGNGEQRRVAGATVHVHPGGRVSCTAQLQGDADAWALGSTAAWLAAMVTGDHANLELGGDYRLARSLLEALHNTLFVTQESS